VSLAPASSFLTEVGQLCERCFARYQNQQEARARAAADLDRSLFRRAKLIGVAHWIIWASASVLVAEAMALPGEIGTAMLVAVAALSIGLALRQRWAYVAALAIDWPGAAVLIVIARVSFKPSRGWIGLFVPPFMVLIGYLLWRLRDAYPKSPHRG
jgi:hypothetical protein